MSGDGASIKGKTVRVLLGNSEGLLNRFIETLINEVCQARATVECVGTDRFEEFVGRGSGEEWDLLILLPNNLCSGATTRATRRPIEDGVRAIQAVKSLRPAPCIVIALFQEWDLDPKRLREAGADSVLGLPFDCDDLKRTVARLLRLPIALEAAWS